MGIPTSHPELGLYSAHVVDDAAGIPDDDWCRLFFEHVYCGFDDADFACMYEEGGRYPISPSLLASITILQYMFKISDRVAVDNTVRRRDWRIALGRNDQWDGFDPSVLCNFRKRLIAHGMERELFETVLDRLRELRLLSKRRRLRVDATHLVADVAVLSRVDSIREAIRIVVCGLHRMKPTLERRPEFARLLDVYGQEVWLGQSKGSDGELTQLALDGQALLEICGGRPVKGKEVLAKMLQENFVFPEDGPPEPLDKDQRPDDRILTPHEPDARAGKKGDKIWTGDKVHFVETADEDQPNFIVDVMSTDPRVEDSTVLEQVAQRAKFIVPDAEQLLADGGYASATNTRRVAAAGIDLVAPPRGSNSHGRLPVSEFNLDFERRIATCPAGHDSTYWRPNGRQFSIRFDAGTCAACPLRSECTTSPRGRSLGISIDYQQLTIDRERAATDEFKDLYKKRASIEATISHLVRDCGLRRSRYRSGPKRALHAIFAATALNVRRLLHWLPTVDAPQDADSGAFSRRFRRLTDFAWQLLSAILRPILYPDTNLDFAVAASR